MANSTQFSRETASSWQTVLAKSSSVFLPAPDPALVDTSVQPDDVLYSFEDQFSQLVLSEEHVWILDSLEKEDPVLLIWDGQRYADDRDGKCIKNKIRIHLARFIAQADKQIQSGITGDMIVADKVAIHRSNVARYIESPGYGSCLVREVFRSIMERPELVKSEEDFDSDPFMLNTPKGFLDLRTLTLFDHDPSQMVRNLTRADYIEADADQETPELYLSIVKSAIYQKDRSPVENDEIFQSAIDIIASSLIGENSHKIIPCFVGPTNTGKSTELYIREKCLGDYSVSINAKGLMKTARSNLDIRPDIVKVRSARLISAVETEKADVFDSRLLKSLSGNDELSFRRPHRDTVHFRLKGKIFLATNELPRLSDIDDTAFLKRLVLIEFRNTVPDSMIDGDLKSKLTQKRAMDVIFTYLANCASRQIVSKKLAIAHGMMTSKGRFIMERSDIVKQFWDDMVTTRPSDEYSIGQTKYSSRIIYANSFVPYCYEHGIKPPTITAWGTRFFEIASLFAGVQRKGGGREATYYTGIDVKLKDRYAVNREIVDNMMTTMVNKITGA